MEDLIMHISFSDKEIKRILKNNGFAYHHQKGSHEIYKNVKGEHISIRFKDCNSMIMLRLIKQYNLVV